jgi:hypothetical protein
MTDLIVVPQAAHWQRLKRLVLDSVSSPITRRVYNLGLDEFFAWFSLEPRPGFTKATVAAWRVALEARGLGAVSIKVRITAVHKLAVEAADNGLQAPELANGITRVKGVASKASAWGTGFPSSRRRSFSTHRTPRRRRVFGTVRSWRSSWAAGSGDRRWRLSPSRTSSSVMAGGASWTSLGSMVGYGQSRCRRGSKWRRMRGLPARVSLADLYSGP